MVKHVLMPGVTYMYVFRCTAFSFSSKGKGVIDMHKDHINDGSISPLRN